LASDPAIRSCSVIPHVTVYFAVATWAVTFAGMTHHLWRQARAMPDPA